MADDIDVLGQSLLNRQRTNRKRADKRSRKERNINLGLNLAAKGVGYANTYLKNRADTFVNEQEELVGLRIKQQNAIRRSQATIADMDAAQAYPTGPQGWLAQEKFAPIIAANAERDLETQKWSPTDINNWVYDEATKQAEEYFPTFQKSYDAAMRMGTIDDYDTYVKTKDGRAENVGGFLFNKLTRSLKNKTQADFDSEVVTSLRKSRFNDNADAMLNFDNLLKQGYSVIDAVDLNAEALTQAAQDEIDSANASIGRPKIIRTETNQITKEVRVGLDVFSIPLTQTLTTDERNNTNETFSQSFSVDGNGNKQLTNSDLYKIWLGNDASSSATSLPPETLPVDPDVPELTLAQRMANGSAVQGPRPPTGRLTTLKYPHIQEVEIFRIPVYDATKRTSPTATPTPIGYVEKIIPVGGTMKPQQGIGNIDPSIITAGTIQVNEALNNFNILAGDGKNKGSLTENKVLQISIVGTSLAMLEDYEKDPSSTRATNLVADLNTLKANISGETYNATQELTTGNGLFAGEEYDYDETSLLVLTANLIPYINGYDSDNKTYNRNADTFGYKEYPSSSLLLADRHLDESYTGNWNGLEPATYKKLVMGALEEVRKEVQLKQGEYILSEKGSGLVKALSEIEQVANTPMLLTTFDTSAIDPDRPNLKEIIESSRGSLVVDGGITLSTLVSTLRGEKDDKEDEPRDIEIEDYKTTSAPEPVNVATSILETLKTNTEQKEKYDLAMSAYIKEGMVGGLQAGQANTYAKDMIDRYGTELPK
tara:strand:+ start:1303 stop:3609 length:2307 start_codon:yes stop_codon:yes gene_type:complete